MSSLIAILVATLAQAMASAVFILAPELYSKMHGGKEAWPILIPVVVTAFGLETLLLFLLLRFRKGWAFLFKMSLAVLASWIAGVASFLWLDAAARSLHIRPPIFSWLIGLAVLSILLLLAKRSKAEAGRSSGL